MTSIKMKTKRRSSFVKADSHQRSTLSGQSQAGLDIERAMASLGQVDIRCLQSIYAHCSAGSGGVLTRTGLQRAMQLAGVQEPLDYTEQLRIKRVQEEVLRQTRPQEGHDPFAQPNPMNDKNGTWELREFVMMIASIDALQHQDIVASNLELAAELEIPAPEVAALRDLFIEGDADGSGSVSLDEMQKMLARVKVSASVKDIMSVLEIPSSTHCMTFKDFVSCAHKLGSILLPRKVSINLDEVDWFALRG